MEILATIILMSISILNYKIVPRHAYPPFIFSLLWTFIIVLYCIAKFFLNLNIYGLSDECLLLYSSGSVIFSIGGLFPMIIKWNHVKASSNTLETLNKKCIFYLDFLFFSCIMALPFYVKKAFELSSSTGIENFFIGLRYALTNEKNYDSYGVWSYFLIISLVNLVLRMYYKNYLKNNIYFTISIIVMLVYSILFTGRTYLYMILLFIYAILLLNNKITFKGVLYFVVAVVLIFFSSAFLLKKGGDTDGDILTNIVNIFDIFIVYLLGALPAFSQFLESRIDYTYGLEIFRSIHVVLFKLGFVSSPPIELVKTFTYVPFSTNVYTIYYQYIKDFGYAGLGIFFILGYFHSYIYKKTIVSNSGFYKILYSLLLYPIFFSFFQEQYFSLMSMWIQLFFILALFYFFKSQ